jgi:hypothetical protein
MVALTKEYCMAFAKSMGCKLKETHPGYELTTAYGTYRLSTLKEVDSRLIKDTQRLQRARF